MNRTLWKLSAVLMLPLAVFATSAFPNASAMPKGQVERGEVRPHKPEFAENHKRIIEQLNLSEEQQARIKTIREQGKAQGKALHEEIRAKRRELMTYLKSPNASEAKALAIQSEIDALQAKLSAKRIHVWFQMREVLTPEQLKQLQSLQKPRPR
ncbi:MAG TPA: Spy/CpxP family protein refolding chaperone [Oculatellaceae cyanobacterium]